MTRVKQGDQVTINYIGKLEDDTIIDSTYPDPEESCDCESGDHSCDDGDCCQESGPLQLTIGEGSFYIPIEEALIGMAPGEKKTVTISPDDAFGDYNPENVLSVPREKFPAEIEPAVGLGLEVTGEDDDVYMVTIIAVTEDEIRLDANHPLAGETLNYTFELLEIL